MWKKLRTSPNGEEFRQWQRTSGGPMGCATHDTWFPPKRGFRGTAKVTEERVLGGEIWPDLNRLRAETQDSY